MTKLKSRNRPAAKPPGRRARNTVGMAKAANVMIELRSEIYSELSPGISDHHKGGVFANAVLFLMRDDYDGQDIFEPWQIGKVVRLLASSARIQTNWKIIGHIEQSLDELIPEMAGLIDRIIMFKWSIQDRPAWQHFEELLPDRFLKAVFRSFSGKPNCPPFYTHVELYNWEATPRTDFAGLIRLPGGRDE